MVTLRLIPAPLMTLATNCEKVAASDAGLSVLLTCWTWVEPILPPQLMPELLAGGALRFENADFEIDLLAAGEGQGIDDRRAAELGDDGEHFLHRDVVRHATRQHDAAVDGRDLDLGVGHAGLDGAGDRGGVGADLDREEADGRAIGGVEIDGGGAEGLADDIDRAIGDRLGVGDAGIGGDDLADRTRDDDGDGLRDGQVDLHHRGGREIVADGLRERRAGAEAHDREDHRGRKRARRRHQESGPSRHE